MIKNHPLKQSPIKKLFTERNSVTVDKSCSEDDELIRENQNQSYFMKRFKNNQQTLRNKFKNYVDKQKHMFPKAYKKLNDSNFEETGGEEDIRKIRKQKEELIRQMNRSQNETSYYLHRNHEYLKACDILANKWRRVESIRKQRKSEVIQLQTTMKAIKEEIKSEKLAFMKKIVDSKFSLTKSRMQFKQRKLSLAKDMRAQKQLHRSKISKDKLQSVHQNQLKCQTVRDSQLKVPFSVHRVKQQKQQQANELKLSRLFRELTQRQQAKIYNAKVKRKSNQQIQLFRSQSMTLEEKIKQFRKSLGQRRLNPIPKAKFGRYTKNRSFTQQNDFSTTEFFDAHHISTEQTPCDGDGQ